MRLVTVTIGGTPAGNSAAMMPRASAARSTNVAVPPGASNVLASRFWSGVSPTRAEGARTPDLLGAIQALSQLSYSPVGPETRALAPGPTTPGYAGGAP